MLDGGINVRCHAHSSKVPWMKHGYTKWCFGKEQKTYFLSNYTYSRESMCFQKFNVVYHALYPWQTLGSKHEKLTVKLFVGETICATQHESQRDFFLTKNTTFKAHEIAGCSWNRFVLTISNRNQTKPNILKQRFKGSLRVYKVCPTTSMYSIFTYIWLIFMIFMVNAGKYTIHGSYGCCYWSI